MGRGRNGRERRGEEERVGRDGKGVQVLSSS